MLKNKVAAPFKITELDIYYNEGFSRFMDILNVAIKEAIVTKSGSWFQFGDEKIGQGTEGARQFLKENPDVVDKIVKLIKKQ